MAAVQVSGWNDSVTISNSVHLCLSVLVAVV
jgi:hypothetical protein